MSTLNKGSSIYLRFHKSLLTSCEPSEQVNTRPQVSCVYRLSIFSSWQWVLDVTNQPTFGSTNNLFTTIFFTIEPNQKFPLNNTPSPAEYETYYPTITIQTAPLFTLNFYRILQNFGRREDFLANGTPSPIPHSDRTLSSQGSSETLEDWKVQELIGY